MKKHVVIGALLAVAFVAGRLSTQAPSNAVAQGGGGGTPCGNGDVNGDEEINISDPVYLLEDLFRDGPDPVPIVCPPTGLPATGQTLCYDSGGTVIACDSADYPGQDGAYQAGCPTGGRFVDNEDGTVTDTCTGLMWQKNTADVNGDGQVSVENDGGDRISWQAALKYCESLDLAGHDDWRLPNVRELQSIARYGRFQPAIDPTFEAESDWYWSSTSYFYPAGAWYVSFIDGNVNSYDKGYDNFFVRAVRGGL